ncbi:hypothetical protein RBB50_010736 [Rhinocladiella similis]
MTSRCIIPLKITVVGAGLGGLAAAVALHLSGHEVQVLEGAPQFGEIGAGIQVPPNCSKALKWLGVFESVAQEATWPGSIAIKRWKDGRLLGSTALRPEMENLYGSPYLLTHRADLHKSLLERCMQLGIQVHPNSFVVSVDPDGPSARLANGTVIESDVLIGADGVKSKVRDTAIMPGLPATFQPEICCVFRCLIPGEAMRSDSLSRPFLDSPAASAWLGPNGHIMAYPIRQGEVYNFNLTHSGSMSGTAAMRPASIETIAAIFEGWDPIIHRLLEKVATSGEWRMTEIEELPRWTLKKVALLGDSAHAMLPFLAQGAAMAIEDSITLAECLARCTSTSDIPFRLTQYEKLRRERVQIIKEGARKNAAVWHMADGPAQEARDRTFDQFDPSGQNAGEMAQENANSWSDKNFQPWLFGFDASAEAAKQLDLQDGIGLKRR